MHDEDTPKKLALLLACQHFFFFCNPLALVAFSKGTRYMLKAFVRYKKYEQNASIGAQVKVRSK